MGDTLKPDPFFLPVRSIGRPTMDDLGQAKGPATLGDASPVAAPPCTIVLLLDLVYLYQCLATWSRSGHLRCVGT